MSEPQAVQAERRTGPRMEYAAAQAGRLGACRDCCAASAAHDLAPGPVSLQTWLRLRDADWPP